MTFIYSFYPKIRLAQSHHKKIKIITNRKQAIYQTLIELKDSPETVLLIAGKGHESYQEINGKQYEFNDKDMIRSVMSTI